MAKISIIGGGSWGTAIAQTLSKNNHSILLYERITEVTESINKDRVNINYFPEIKLSKNITATNNIKETLSFSDYIFISVPTQFTGKIMKKIHNDINQEKIIISTAKGIEEKSFLRNSQIIEKYFDHNIAVLSGPTHAEEVISSLPSAAVVVSKDLKIAEKIQDLLMSRTFRIYTSDDLIGVELGGAVKNIIAIAAGIVEGLGYGDNTKAALITRGLAEIRRFGIYLGGKPLTFSGLTGMGDLVVTCTSHHSRNFRFGIEIGKGLSMEKALKKIKQTVEGIRTTSAVYDKARELNLDFDLPITNQIYQVLFNNKEPLDAVDELMLRDPKKELDI